MCGIFGYIGSVPDDKREPFFKLLEALFNASEVRGTHASGFAARWDDGTVEVDKLPYRGAVFTMLSRKFQSLATAPLPTSFIAHTRYGTGSAPRLNNNNHPFEGERFVMVHNGTIPGWSEKAKAEGISDKFVSETDSEVIIRLLDKRGKEDVDSSIQWILNNVWGNMAVALLSRNEPDIWLYRNENPLSVFTIEKKVFGETIHFFCSTQAIFDTAWNLTFGHSASKDVTASVLMANRAYILTQNPHTIRGKPCKFIVFDTKVARPFYKQTTYQYGYEGAWSEHYKTTKLDEGSKDFSMRIIDPMRPEVGLSIDKEAVDEIRQRIANKKLVTLIDGIEFEKNAIISTFMGRMAVLDKIGVS